MNEEQCPAGPSSSVNPGESSVRGLSASPCCPVTTPPSDWADYWKNAAASLLYCLSAMFILIGVWKLIGPAMAHSEQIKELLKCVSVLNVYELAVLGVLVLIIKVRDVTDDAISLSILIALFLVASGIAIDTIAVTGPIASAIFGSICLLLGMVKLAVMRRHVGIRFHGPLLAGLAILLSWNFLIAPAMAVVQAYKAADAALLRQVWQIGWLVMLAGYVPVLIHALRSDSETSKDGSFLRGSLMAWILVMVLSFAAGLHQYSAAYSFGVRTEMGDYLPLVAILCILCSEVMRQNKVELSARVVVSLVPLLLGLYVVAEQQYLQQPAAGTNVIGYPPFLLELMCAFVAWRAFKTRQHAFWYVAGAYLLGVVLTFGASSSTAFEELNWEALGVVLLLGLVALAIIKRNVKLAIFSVLIVAIGSSLSPAVARLAEDWGLEPADAWVAVMGVGLTVLYLLFRKTMPRPAAMVGAMCSTIFLLRLQYGGGVPFWITGIAVAGFLAWVIWRRTRDKLFIAILGLPVLPEIYPFVSKAGDWLYVCVSFVLLAAGAVVSLRKKTPVKNGPNPPVLDEVPPLPKRTSINKPVGSVSNTLGGLLIIAACLGLWGAFFSGETRSRELARRTQCQSNLHQFDLVLQAYCCHPGENYPTNLADLHPEDVALKLFVHPGGKNLPTQLSNVMEWTDYIYISGLGPTAPAEVPVFICPPMFHEDKGASMLMGDHSCTWFPDLAYVDKLIEDPLAFCSNPPPGLRSNIYVHVSKRIEEQSKGKYRSHGLK